MSIRLLLRIPFPQVLPEGLPGMVEAVSGQRARVEAKPLVVARGGAETDHGAADEVDGWR